MTRKSHLEALDGLRGVAALGVVALHIGERFSLPHYPRHAYLAVPFFFVLSGYVIARSYEDRIISGALSLARFAEIRAIRLYPLLLLAVLLALCLGAKPWAVALGALLLPALWGSNGLFPANGPEWSLFTEVIGNGFHAILAKHLGMRSLVIAVSLCALGSVAAAVHFGSLEIGWNLRSLPASFALFGFAYFSGVIIYRLQAADRLPKVGAPLLVTGLCYIFATCFPQVTGTFASGIRDAFATLVVFPIILVLSVQDPKPSIVDSACKFAGLLSYPLYITHHVFILAAADWAYKEGFTNKQRYLLAVPLVLFCIAFAWLAYKLYDVPVRQWLSKRARVRRAQPSAGPA